MDFWEKYNLSPGRIAKIFGVFLLGLVLILVTFQLIGGISRSLRNGGAMYEMDSGYGGAVSSKQSGMMGYGSDEAIGLSSRNIVLEDDFSPGMDAEDFEITEYYANIETRKLDESCEKILGLKSRSDVIFEDSNKSDNNCNFRFKVKREVSNEVIAIINELNPRELNENIETIKKQIDDFTSQEEILNRKLASMEATLSSAISSYDEISKLATQTRDAESLATIIKSKIDIIERLTNEKINITSQLERISRDKAEKLDKLEYTYFNVYIQENKYVDIEEIKDSWKRSLKKFVTDMNNVAQDLSVGLVALVVYVFQYLLYLLIIVMVAKYIWKLFKKIWFN